MRVFPFVTIFDIYLWRIFVSLISNYLLPGLSFLSIFLQIFFSLIKMVKISWKIIIELLFDGVETVCRFFMEFLSADSTGMGNVLIYCDN